MTLDPFVGRIAQVRERFVSTLLAKIEQACAALPDRGDAPRPATEAATAVADAYRSMHGIVGIGRTVGFAVIGSAAREVESVLRAPYRAGRGLSAEEIPLLKRSLQNLDEIARRELQSLRDVSLPQ